MLPTTSRGCQTIALKLSNMPKMPKHRQKMCRTTGTQPQVEGCKSQCTIKGSQLRARHSEESGPFILFTNSLHSGPELTRSIWWTVYRTGKMQCYLYLGIHAVMLFNVKWVVSLKLVDYWMMLLVLMLLDGKVHWGQLSWKLLMPSNRPG